MSPINLRRLWLAMMMMMMLLFALDYSLPVPALAQEQTQELWQEPDTETNKIPSSPEVQTVQTKAKPPAAKEYDDIASDDYENARTLCLKAEQCMRQGAYARAIRHLNNAMQKDPKDPDVHELLAIALEERMHKLHHVDSKSYERCVLEWTRMYRGEIGEEKGVTFKGVGLGAGMFSGDERAQKAKSHLIKVVGFLPKPWETNVKYVKRASESMQKRSAEHSN
ncbi:MAG: hypothetical protein IPL73_09705 [Candidatus Obscuribacter sp.]|nr:hypothetical protein [Candidatus Obscuribacter sp.]MBK9202693.1 hypothetical protein [Candidatus Obscuribacter sp.]